MLPCDREAHSNSRNQTNLQQQHEDAEVGGLQALGCADKRLVARMLVDVKRWLRGFAGCCTRKATTAERSIALKRGAIGKGAHLLISDSEALPRSLLAWALLLRSSQLI